MSSMQAAQRYSKTLFLYAREKGIVDDVVKDMDLISDVFQQTPALKTFLSNPLESSKVFETLKNSGLSKIISKDTLAFLNLLHQKNRINILGEVPDIFKDLYQSNQNLLDVKIKSSTLLTKKQIDKIKQSLKLKFPGKEFLFDNLIDSGLIAGFQIQIGDTIIDSNIKSNLEQIKKKLAA